MSQEGLLRSGIAPPTSGTKMVTSAIMPVKNGIVPAVSETGSHISETKQAKSVIMPVKYGIVPAVSETGSPAYEIRQPNDGISWPSGETSWPKRLRRGAVRTVNRESLASRHGSDEKLPLTGDEPHTIVLQGPANERKLSSTGTSHRQIVRQAPANELDLELIGTRRS